MSVVSVISAVVVFLFAAMWLTVGVLGLVGRLPGNRWFGVRSAETVHSEEAFTLANRVAGPGLIGAALILAMGGLLSLGVDGSWSWLFAAVALVAALFIVGLVSNLGIRAAAALPEPASDGCGGGCCSGDDSGHGGTGHSDAAPAAGGCAPVASSEDPAVAAAADCGQSSCGACSLRGMCESEPAAR